MPLAPFVQALLRRYAAGEASAVGPFLVGRRVLDLGAGEGYAAVRLRDASGVWVCGADVGPFCRGDVPYVVYDGARMPFPDSALDTTLILLTLHHCAQAERVLDEALRVTRWRLIVTESVYRSGHQRFWLNLLDGRINRLRHGGGMAPPVAFRRPEEWEALFASRGLRIVATRWIGPWWERLVHHPLLFVLDKH